MRMMQLPSPSIIPSDIQNQLRHLLTIQLAPLPLHINKLSVSLPFSQIQSHAAVEPPRSAYWPAEHEGVEGHDGGTGLDDALAEIAGAPGVRLHCDGVAGEGVGFCEVAGCAAEHGAHLCC